MATGIQTGMQRGSRSGISRGSALGKGAPGGGGSPLEKAQEIWKSLGKGPRIAIGVLFTVLLCGGAIFGLHASKNQHVDLYPTKMTANDVTEVSAALIEMRIEHTVSETNDGILVHPKDRIRTQAALATRNLPRAPVLTADAVEGGMGKTAAEQKAIRQQLLEGDITLALRAMEGVNDARVKLAIPDKTYFQDESKQTTARVLLSVSPGAQLSRERIQGMVNLVAFSVPELRTENVAIIDSSGQDLTAMLPGADASGIGISGTQLEVQAQEEIRLQQKAQQALDEVMPGRTKVSVNLDMDFSKYEEERFTPGGAADDGVVVESRQVTRELLNKGDKDSSSEGHLMSSASRKDGSSDYVNEKESVNHMVQQHKVTRVDTGFRVKRLTASILADNVSDDEKSAIAGYVRNAIGIDLARGDEVAVHSIAFDRQMMGGAAGMAGGFAPAEQIPAAAGAGINASHLTAAFTVGAAMLLGLVGLFLVKQHKVQEHQGTIITATAGGVTSTTITDHFTEKSGKTTGPAASAGATQVNTTDQLEQLVDERPTKVAEMLKSTWLSQS